MVHCILYRTDQYRLYEFIPLSAPVPFYYAAGTRFRCIMRFVALRFTPKKRRRHVGLAAAAASANVTATPGLAVVGSHFSVVFRGTHISRATRQVGTRFELSRVACEAGANIDKKFRAARPREDTVRPEVIPRYKPPRLIFVRQANRFG